MADKPNKVEITEFSKKSLDQLKKTFAPSMESMFEARKKATEGLGLDSNGKAKDGKDSKFGIGRMLTVVGVALANFAVMLGTLLTGVISGFTVKLKEMFSMTKLGKWFKTKWTDLKKSMKTKWSKLIVSIKESDLVVSITKSWDAFTARLSKTFTPLMEWLGLKGGDDAETKKPKSEGRMMKLLDKFKAFFLKWPKTLLVGRALGRFIPWLWPMILTWEGVNGLIEGWEKTEKEKPDATFLQKLKGAVEGGIERLWNFCIVETGNIIGAIAKWLTENTLRLFGFDTAADRIKEQSNWDLGTWMDNVMKEVLYGFRWIFGLTDNPEKDSLVGKIRIWWKTWKWDPQKWLDDFGNWADKLLMEAADWIIQKLKNIWDTISAPFRNKNKVKNLAGTSQVNPNNSVGQEGPEGYTPKNMYGENYAGSQGGGKLNKGKTEPTSQKVIDAAKLQEKANAGVGNVHEQLQKGPISFGPSLKKMNFTPDIKSDVDADGVQWSKFGGWQNVVKAINSVWKPEWGTPTITSGKRSTAGNKAAGGLPTSKHLSGDAFDLRNFTIPESQRLDVYKALKFAMSTDTRKIKGDPHLDRKKREQGAHFHFQAAAKGVSERISGPKLYLAGEQGPEYVHIQPISDPNMSGNNYRRLMPDMAGVGASPSPTIINNIDNSQKGGNTTAIIKTDIDGQTPRGHDYSKDR